MFPVFCGLHTFALCSIMWLFLVCHPASKNYFTVMYKNGSDEVCNDLMQLEENVLP